MGTKKAAIKIRQTSINKKATGRENLEWFGYFSKI